jgi:large subunit ribosomal protein L25
MDLELALDPRVALGKENRRLRREGLVPGVVFGKGIESTPVQVEAKRFETLYRSAGRSSIIKIKVDGAGTGKSAIIKSVQRNPLSGNALHVDFFVVDLKQEIEVDIPLAFTGEAPAIEETGGSLMHALDHVRIKALPDDIPHEISVDVSGLVDLETAIHVRDLAIDERVQMLTDLDELVAKVLPPRAEEPEEVVVAEGEEGEEGVEGEEGTAEGEERPSGEEAPTE